MNNELIHNALLAAKKTLEAFIPNHSDFVNNEDHRALELVHIAIREFNPPDDRSCTSWLHGTYSNGEINTKLPFVAVKEPEFFAQGEEAEAYINNINAIYNAEDITSEEAFNKWVNENL